MIDHSIRPGSLNYILWDIIGVGSEMTETRNKSPNSITQANSQITTGQGLSFIRLGKSGTVEGSYLLNILTVDPKSP